MFFYGRRVTGWAGQCHIRSPSIENPPRNSFTFEKSSETSSQHYMFRTTETSNLRPHLFNK